MIPRSSQEMLLCPNQDQLLEDGFEELFYWQDKTVIFPFLSLHLRLACINLLLLDLISPPY